MTDYKIAHVLNVTSYKVSSVVHWLLDCLIS